MDPVRATSQLASVKPPSPHAERIENPLPRRQTILDATVFDQTVLNAEEQVGAMLRLSGKPEFPPDGFTTLVHRSERFPPEKVKTFMEIVGGKVRKPEATCAVADWLLFSPDLDVRPFLEELN